MDADPRAAPVRSGIGEAARHASRGSRLSSVRILVLSYDEVTLVIENLNILEYNKQICIDLRTRINIYIYVFIHLISLYT